jgi:hypothetical protein
MVADLTGVRLVKPSSESISRVAERARTYTMQEVLHRSQGNSSELQSARDQIMSSNPAWSHDLGRTIRHRFPRCCPAGVAKRKPDAATTTGDQQLRTPDQPAGAEPTQHSDLDGRPCAQPGPSDAQPVWIGPVLRLGPALARRDRRQSGSASSSPPTCRCSAPPVHRRGDRLGAGGLFARPGPTWPRCSSLSLPRWPT